MSVTMCARIYSFGKEKGCCHKQLVYCPKSIDPLRCSYLAHGVWDREKAWMISITEVAKSDHHSEVYKRANIP